MYICGNNHLSFQTSHKSVVTFNAMLSQNHCTVLSQPCFPLVLIKYKMTSEFLACPNLKCDRQECRGLFSNYYTGDNNEFSSKRKNDTFSICFSETIRE